MSAETDIRDYAIRSLACATGASTVRAWANLSAAPAFPEVAVNLTNVERVAPNYDFYHADLEIFVARHVDDDKTGVASESIINAVRDWLQSASVATFASATTAATIDGVIQQGASSVQAAGERHIVFAATLRIFYTRQPAGTGTTAPAATATPTPEPPTATGTAEPPTPTGTPEAPTPTATPEPPTATGTPEVPTPTATPEPPTATGTPEPPTATGTPEPPTATGTPEPPTPTATPTPTPGVFEDDFNRTEAPLNTTDWLTWADIGATHIYADGSRAVSPSETNMNKYSGAICKHAIGDGDQRVEADISSSSNFDNVGYIGIVLRAAVNGETGIVAQVNVNATSLQMYLLRQTGFAAQQVIMNTGFLAYETYGKPQKLIFTLTGNNLSFTVVCATQNPPALTGSDTVLSGQYGGLRTYGSATTSWIGWDNYRQERI